MTAGQPLRGFVGQTMSGTRKALSPSTSVFNAPDSGGPAVAATFTPPRTGWFRFIMWGPGAGYNSGVGSGGALVVAERLLVKGQAVAVSVSGGDSASGTPTGTTVTLATGEILRAGAGTQGTGQAGGVASGRAALGDILVNGSPSTALGGNAATSGEYRGGLAPATTGPGGFPGGGSGGTGLYAIGGAGVVFVVGVRLRQ